MLKHLWIGALPLLAAAGRAAAQQQPNPSFYLINKADIAISRVFATPVGMGNWGRNRLANDTIPPGQSYPIRLPADGNCVYDVRVTYANGRNEERRGLNTCNVDNVTFPPSPADRGARAPRSQRPADDPSFLLVNRSRNPVSELYLSMSDDDDWGQDRLGDAALPGGASRAIRLPAGECFYDMRVVFGNGEASERRRLNLCLLSSLQVR